MKSDWLESRWLPAWLLSGLLCGASYLFIPGSLFPALAWFGLVPLLRRLETVGGFRRFYGEGLAMLWIVELFTLGRVFDIGALGSLLVVTVQALVVSGVFVLFWLLRAALGWRGALLALPACWTAWEWLYAQQPLQIPTLLGATQADFYPLIQFYDLTGVWGGSFLIVACNILLNLAFSSPSRKKYAALALAAVFIPPLAYSAWVFATADRTTASTLRVAVAQTGDTQRSTVAPARQAATVSQAVLAAHPELLVWPETALERDTAKANNRQLWHSLYAWVAGNAVPVLTGIVDIAPSPSVLPWGEDEERFNAATLITPQLAYYALGRPADGALETKVYRKRKPFPFAERVPFLDAFPALYPLVMHEPHEPSRNYGYGDRPVTFALLDGAGRKHRMGAFICYEALFPGVVADLARHGAELLVTVSNDAKLNPTARWVTAAHIPLRAIETRRAIVRSGTVGHTLFVDAFGRVEHTLPLEMPGAAVRPVKLASGVSLYVRWGDWFPAACALAIALLVAWGVLCRWMHEHAAGRVTPVAARTLRPPR